MKRIVIILASLMAIAVVLPTAFAQSTKRKGVKPSKLVVDNQSESTIGPLTDTITEVSVIDSIITITNFNKTVLSRVESVLIKNNSDSDTVRSVEIDIDYRTPEGIQLNRRTVTFSVDIPPNETRHTSVSSWDRQQLFYYVDNPPVRKTQRTKPFSVTLTPRRLIITHRQ